jgi:Glycopeptide antibiotics resistance protein
MTYYQAIYPGFITSLGLLAIMVPYIVVKIYRKKQISFKYTLLLFSFLVYLACAFSMTIFPLPSREYVENMASLDNNFTPFIFVRKIILHSPLVLSDISTWSEALHETFFLQAFLNIILTLPFGFYLKYLFKLSSKKALLYSFLLTAFFEITQASALYGFYPKAYRYFDVDDLLLNTTGSMLGYLLASILVKYLPTNLRMKYYSFPDKIRL